MNSVIMMGRLTRDPEVRYSSGESSTAIANYRIAVDRRFRRDGQPEADFFDCVAFGRQAEFAEKYLHQGTKMVIQGRLQNDNYTDKDGRTVYRNRIVVESQEFAESKAAGQRSAASYTPPADSAMGGSSQASGAPSDGFMNVPDSIDEELPFI